MFYPLRKSGRLYVTIKKNAYGDRVYSTEPVKFGWAPVYMRDSQQDSSVRADSSSSRGRADEQIIDFRLIIEKRVKPKKGDKIILDNGDPMIVVKVHERMDIVGRLHHWEVDCATA